VSHPAFPFVSARRGPPWPSRRVRGFTLVELLATIAVAAVVAGLALPQLNEFVQNNARATRLNTLVAALTYTRGQAIALRKTLKLCSSANIGVVSPPTCRTGGELNRFQNGFIVLDGADLVRAFQPQGAGVFDLRGFDSVGAPFGAVDFLATGRIDTANANSRFVYCDSRDQLGARGIVLSATGSPRTTNDVDDNGIDDIDGVDLICPHP